MNTHKQSGRLDGDTRRYLRDEAEWLSQREIEARNHIELVVVRLGRGDGAPRYIKSQGTDHSVILTKRVVVYDPYTGIRRLGAQLLGLTILPAMTMAWVVDSLVYGFTKSENWGLVTAPGIIWDLIRYPGQYYSERDTREGGGRHVNR